MKSIKTINKLLFIILAFSPIFGAETDDVSLKQDNKKEEASTTSKALETCKEIAEVAGEEAWQFNASLAKTFFKKSFEKYCEKPVFDLITSYFERHLGEQKLVDNKIIYEVSTGKKTVGAATLAALYVLYKWYTTEKGKDPKKQVEVDIRPKSFKAFLILLLDKDSGVDLIKRFNYELQTIKKDIETGNKQGLELLTLLYPDLIASLDATQRQYLNDLIKQVTETDTIVIVPAKDETKPAVA